MKIAREKLDGGGFHNHALSATGDSDRTLCGYAFEGECATGGDPAVAIMDRGRVNCGTCLKIIRHCKAIPARNLSR